jgi:CHAT domain-containing protein
LREGVETAEALRQAQIAMLRDGRHEDPFFWAAFTLYGGSGSRREV